MFHFQLKHQNVSIDDSKYGIEALLAYGMEEPHCFHVMFVLDDCMKARACAMRAELATKLQIPKDQIVVITKEQLICQTKKGDLYCWYLRQSCKIIYHKSNFIKELLNCQIPRPNMEFETKSVIQFVDNSMQLYRQKRLNCYAMLAILAEGIGDLGEHVCIRHGSFVFHKKNAVEKCFHCSDVTLPFTYQQYCVLYKYWCSYKENQTLPRPMLVDLAVDEWYQAFCKFAKC